MQSTAARSIRKATKRPVSHFAPSAAFERLTPGFEKRERLVLTETYHFDCAGRAGVGDPQSGQFCLQGGALGYKPQKERARYFGIAPARQGTYVYVCMPTSLK